MNSPKVKEAISALTEKIRNMPVEELQRQYDEHQPGDVYRLLLKAFKERGGDCNGQ